MDTNNDWLVRRRRGFKKPDSLIQACAGLCRGAAIDHSPGLQPWVGQTRVRALKASPTRKAGAIRTEHIDPIPTQLATNKLSRGRGRRRGRERCASRVAPDVRIRGNNTELLERTPRSPLVRQSFRNALSELHLATARLGMLSGRFNLLPNPGLKPSAILFNRFAVAHLIGRARAKSGEESDSPAL
jgi:hypothetical protein